MKAYRFKPELTQSGDLKLPTELRAELADKHGAVEAVIFFIHDLREDGDWATLTGAEFLAGYDDADAVYDALV